MKPHFFHNHHPRGPALNRIIRWLPCPRRCVIVECPWSHCLCLLVRGVGLPQPLALCLAQDMGLREPWALPLFSSVPTSSGLNRLSCPIEGLNRARAVVCRHRRGILARGKGSLKIKGSDSVSYFTSQDRREEH